MDFYVIVKHEHILIIFKILELSAVYYFIFIYESTNLNTNYWHIHKPTYLCLLIL